MRIIDTHLHLIDPMRLTYDWLDKEPHLNRRWTADSYWSDARILGIDGALHVEADVVEADMLAETAQATTIHPGIKGAIANARPERPDFSAYLDALREIRGVVGIRRLLQFLPPEVSQSQLFVQNVGRLAAVGFTFDICLKSHELEVALPLLAACPDVQFVLDHCGNPRVGEGEWEPWASCVRRIASFPNVVCKVSGLLANVLQDWTVETLRPYVEHVIACFGYNRVIWGSDYPILSKHADLRRWVDASRAIVSSGSEHDQAMLFHRNAEQLYRLESKPNRSMQLLSK